MMSAVSAASSSGVLGIFRCVTHARRREGLEVSLCGLCQNQLVQCQVCPPETGVLGLQLPSPQGGPLQWGRFGAQGQPLVRVTGATLF